MADRGWAAGATIPALAALAGAIGGGVLVAMFMKGIADEAAAAAAGAGGSGGGGSPAAAGPGAREPAYVMTARRWAIAIEDAACAYRSMWACVRVLRVGRGALCSWLSETHRDCESVTA